MFIVKATYHNETRRFTLPSNSFPFYDQLYYQLYRVFPTGTSYYLSQIVFTNPLGAKQVIAAEAHSVDEYEAQVISLGLRGRTWGTSTLRFNVIDEPSASQPATVPAPVTRAMSNADSMLVDLEAPAPSQRFVPINEPDFHKAPSSSSHGSCCSVDEGKKELRTMFDKFLKDLNMTMSSTFGDAFTGEDEGDEKHSHGTATPLQSNVSLEPNPIIPGSFTERPATPPSPPLPAREQHLHPGVYCDYCNKQIKGTRYKCNDCANYDLCTECISQHSAQDVHSAICEQVHTFSIIPTPRARRPQPAAAAAPARPNKPVHRGVVCDSCDKGIVGDRHKCLDCSNYDLCEHCISLSSVVHPLHEFLKITEPGRIVVHTVDGGRTAPAIHNATCDLCSSRIHGDRYKCLHCPDFDVCSNCFSITHIQHPNHNWVRVQDPSNIMSSVIPAHSVAHPATCDACDKAIIGVRYKCMHPSCPNFDLCMNCEALPIPVHPETHPLWKIKSNKTVVPFAVKSTETMFHDKTTTTEHAFPAPGYTLIRDVHNAEKIKHNTTDQLTLDSPEQSIVLTQAPGPASLLVPPPPMESQEPEPLRATFLSDNNMEDGFVVAPGAEFVKSWLMMNSGERDWPEETELAFVAGSRLGASSTSPWTFDVGRVGPGQTISVWASDMKAPEEPGKYCSYWRLRSNGVPFGDRIWCDIVVPEFEKANSLDSSTVIMPTAPSAMERSYISTTETDDESAQIHASNSQPTEPDTPLLSGTSVMGSQAEDENTSLIEHSDSEDSEDSGTWRDVAPVDPFRDNEGASMRETELEYVILYDSEDEKPTANEH
ncbi:hypothetical protein SISNIDRAFT_550176 [Sistotremastrum niveocremeum HHB9708]|uniref:ZZ-type domain-containing protein n=1 Tax=Sistotremastrum niveocremeum HHB9708 TaxID=1314777 RepID=A0A164UFR7_9AGAM|nr:hypothetical protein SISNIDRAFT_550176 [Sistotremastrum niveocremeum HHB9708]